MRCTEPTARAIVAVLIVVGLAGCNRGPEIATSIVFDGKSRTLTTKEVSCTRQPTGGLVIMVKDGAKRTVRAQLTQEGRLVVQKVGLRHDDISGFVDDPREVSATKVDDTFTFNGRMPPNPGESQWHTFKIETTCPGYQDALPPKEPGLGAP